MPFPQSKVRFCIDLVRFWDSIPVSIICLFNTSGKELNRNQPVAICDSPAAGLNNGSSVRTARLPSKCRERHWSLRQWVFVSSGLLVTQGNVEGSRSRTTGPNGLVQTLYGHNRRRMCFARLSGKDQVY